MGCLQLNDELQSELYSIAQHYLACSHAMGSSTMYSLVLVMTTWSLSVFVALSSAGLCGKPLQPSLTSLLIAVAAVTVTDCRTSDCVLVVNSGDSGKTSS